MREPAPLVVQLDRNRREPVHRQLYRQLRGAILSGRLRPGTRIPASRTLADELDVSRTTVLTALHRLMVEDLLEARVGSGTWVREPPRERLVPASPASALPADRTRAPVEAAAVAPAPSQRIRRLALDPPDFGGPRRLLEVGNPALDAFPVERWARVAGRRWREAGASQLGYASRTGVRSLREAIAEYVASSRGLSAGPEQVLVTTGSQMGITLCAHALLDRGDRVWMEEPGFGGARGALATAGGRPVPVPVDEEGLRVDEGVRRAPDARLAFLTPSHQFPLGVTLSLARRRALLAWAGEGARWILEDDHDAEYRYEGGPLIALQGLDRHDRVVYVGTFSRTLFPGIRLGFLVVPEPVVDAFADARYLLDQHPPVPHQEALADFIAEGDLARHVRRMRDLYRERRDALLEALAARLAGCLDVVASEGGLHLAVRFRAPVDDRAVEGAARARGLGVLALSPFHAGDEADSGLLLGFGSTPPEEVPRAVDALADAIEEAGSARSFA